MPRPRTDARPISVRLTPDMIDRIDAQADRKGWTRSQWIVRILERGLAGEEAKG